MLSETVSDDDSSILMHFEENRLASFSDWPFEKDCSCTPAKVNTGSVLSGITCIITHSLVLVFVSVDGAASFSLAS